MKKNLPSPNDGYVSFYRLSYDALRWELLRTAMKMNIFDHLTTPRTSQEMAKKIGLHEKNTEHFLNALTALGCLSKNQDRFQNSALGETFFTSGKDTFLSPSLLFMSSWNEPLFHGGLEKLLREGPQTIRDVTEPKQWAKGAEASLNYSRCGRAQKIAETLASLPEFPSFTKILDLGSGPGIMGIAVTARHPSMQCVLFDRPGICEVARQVIQEYGMEDRVTTLEGDFTTDSLEGPYDCIMANFSLGMEREKLQDIMNRLHQALVPGGILAITTTELAADKTSPVSAVLSWTGIFLQGMDMVAEEGALQEHALRAGFSSVQSRLLESMENEIHGPVTFIEARKGF